MRPWNKGLTTDDAKVAAAEAKRRASRVYVAVIGRKASQAKYAARMRERDPLGLINREKRARSKAKLSGTYAEPVDYRLIIERDGWVCCICKLIVVPDDLSFDHAIPFNEGGEHVFQNIRVTHAACNSSKGGYERWGTRKRGQYPRL